MRPARKVKKKREREKQRIISQEVKPMDMSDEINKVRSVKDIRYKITCGKTTTKYIFSNLHFSIVMIKK